MCKYERCIHFDLEKTAFYVYLIHSISKIMISYIENLINWFENLPKSTPS